MEALRTIIKAESEMLNLTIPASFKSKFIEIIIFPIYESVKKEDVVENIQTEDGQNINAFQQFLLTGPVMTDEEYDFFIDKQKHFKQWK